MNNVIYLLRIVLLFLMLNSLAIANPKDYQKILLNEPVTLLDLMIFEAQLELNNYVKNDPFTRIDRYELTLLDFEYLVEPSDNEIALDMFSLSGDVHFEPDAGKFVYTFEKRWSPAGHLRFENNALEYRTEDIERNGLVKISQKNFASYCKNMLIDAGRSNEVTLKTHEGYTTENTRKLPENVFSQVTEDTYYNFTVKLGRYYSQNLVSVKCSASKLDILKLEPKIKYEFIGDWHLLEEILKNEASLMGLIDKKKNIINLD
jgi:hypothetical protein